MLPARPTPTPGRFAPPALLNHRCSTANGHRALPQPEALADSHLGCTECAQQPRAKFSAAPDRRLRPGMFWQLASREAERRSARSVAWGVAPKGREDAVGIPDAVREPNADGEACQKRGAARQIRRVSAIPSAVPAAHLAYPCGRVTSLTCLLGGSCLRRSWDRVDTGYLWNEAGPSSRRESASRPPAVHPDGHLFIAAAAGLGSGSPGGRNCTGGPWPRTLPRKPSRTALSSSRSSCCPGVSGSGSWARPSRISSLRAVSLHVANRWRWHLRRLLPRAVELDALDEAGQAGVLALVVGPPPQDPVAVVEFRDLLARTLAPMSAHDRMSVRAWGAGLGARPRSPGCSASTGTRSTPV